MKGTFLFLLLFSASAKAFNCSSKVDQKSVVFFVDTRNSVAEVEAAARAACARGESFVRMSSRIHQGTFTQELKKLASQNRAVSSLIISGHDGGGNIHGDAGGLDKWEVIKSMKEAYAKKPALMSQFRSVFMWGCWTNGPGEINIWRKELPSLKMTAGFIDTAPLNKTAATHTILKDLLTKEKAILDAKDLNQVKRMLATVENLDKTYASVYVESQCNENLFYYRPAGMPSIYDNSQSPDSLYSKGSHFVNFDESFTCRKAPPNMESNKKAIMDYYLGRTPIPQDTPDSPLRSLYSYALNNSLCLGKIPQFNADRLGLLRFYPAVKTNFARAFDSDIKAANRAWGKLWTYAFNDANLNPYSAEVLMPLRRALQAAKPHVFLPTEKNLANKNRLQIRTMIQKLSAVLASPMAKKYVELKTLHFQMEKYLFQLDPSCMDFLSWHEVGSYTPYGACYPP